MQTLFPEFIFAVLFGTCIALLIFCFLMLIRNQMVSNFRTRLLKMVSAAASEDIKNDKNWKWRYRYLELHDYDEMMTKFWKPLKPEAFWEDTSFLTYKEDNV